MVGCPVLFSPARSWRLPVVVVAAAVFLTAVPLVSAAAIHKKSGGAATKGHVRAKGEAVRAAAARPGGKPGKAGTTKKSRGKVAAKPPALPPARGKVAVFVFKGDDTASSERVRVQVVRALRVRGLKVVTTLRPVDSAEQFREMAVTLDLAVYVDGEVTDDGDQASATVHVRSGVTGLRVASATFAGDRRKLPADVGKALWEEVGEAFSRICADAAKPRKHDRAPMRIEAGTPIENTPAQMEEGT